MIEFSIQSMGSLFEKIISPYAKFHMRYLPGDRSIEQELELNPELFTKYQETDDQTSPGQIPSFMVGFYRRSGLRPTARFGKNRTISVLSNNPSGRFDVSQAIPAQFVFEMTVATQSRELLQDLELLFLSRMKNFSDISCIIKVTEEAAAEEIPLYYDVDSEDFTDPILLEGGRVGSIWTLEYRATVSGYFLTPDSQTYAKLKNVKTRLFMETYGNGEPILQYTIQKNVETGELTFISNSP